MLPARCLPTMYATAEFPEAGGLMAYGPDFSDQFRRASVYSVPPFLARTCRSEVGLEGRAAGKEDNASRGQEASRDENRCAQTDLVGHLSDEPR
jgi:hypothetical protein